jgi:uracil permease
MLCSTYGKKSIKLIPFIIGILSGYALAAVFTVIGNSAGIDALKVIDFGVFSQMSLFEIPNFTFLTAMDGIKEIDASYIGTIAMAYLPVAFVVFA